MPCLMGSHGVILAAAMAVSGTVVVLVLCRHRTLPSAVNEGGAEPPPGSLRPCISGSRRGVGKAREKKRRQKKRVHFAEEVVELRAGGCNAEDEEEGRGSVEEEAPAPPEAPRGIRRGMSECGRQARGGMPANRVALYSGILRDRHNRMACSY